MTIQEINNRFTKVNPGGKIWKGSIYNKNALFVQFTNDGKIYQYNNISTIKLSEKLSLNKEERIEELKNARIEELKDAINALTDEWGFGVSELQINNAKEAKIELKERFNIEL